MSRGYDRDERIDDRNQRPRTEQATTPGRLRETVGRTDGNSRKPAGDRAERGPKRARETSNDARENKRLNMRALEKWYGLSERERGTLREIGRFRTVDADALSKYRSAGKPAAFRKEIARLQQQELLQRRSISVGKNRDTLIIVALTKEGARLVRQDHQLAETQAIYAGFVKPAEVPHDAAIYQMYQTEAKEIEAKGGKVRRVVLDYELKKEVYSKLVREREAGALEYARRQQEIVEEQRLPIVDGKIALPDLRIEYETPEGDLDHVDLELATEHYHRGHMALKTRAGFKMYGFVSTSRGRRAQWEGRELTATVLSL
jgi:hypothetical protein